MTALTGVTERRLALCFKGDRDYVRGADIYAEIVEAVEAAAAPIAAHRVAFHRFARRQCVVVFGRTDEPPAAPAERVADFSCETPQGRIRGFLTETDEAIAHRYAFDEDRLGTHYDAPGARIGVAGAHDLAPIDVVVSLTKKLHNLALPQTAGKWILTKLELQRTLEPVDAGHIEITLRHNFNQRLTKSEVMSRAEPLGIIYFSVWRT